MCLLLDSVVLNRKESHQCSCRIEGVSQNQDEFCIYLAYIGNVKKTSQDLSRLWRLPCPERQSTCFEIEFVRLFENMNRLYTPNCLQCLYADVSLNG